MKSKNPITLSKERKEELISEIKNFFATERDEEVGDLAAGFILDFIMEKIAPEFYNQGVYDAQKYIRESVEDLLSITI